ncbi:ERV/ALR sulfhydryl oxidase domain-containing protein [Auriculariales sp. MPI-PUGE-AT-0066]|nr:ERV/ALR sulfhydryl oxidase domain-containing protein [Auriculariales sp. MPI-PUGE-AT-0066]
MMSRFSRSFVVVAVALLILFSLAMFHSPETARTYLDPITGNVFGKDSVQRDLDLIAQRPPMDGLEQPNDEQPRHEPDVVEIDAHNDTPLPETPTEHERKALKDYFYLMGQLYPCGDCAAHFRKLLAQFPPQTSGRKAASNWLCHVHNQVNERLGKPEFDCAYLGDTYDCGCGPEPSGAKSAAADDDSVEANELDGPVKGGRR